MVLCFHELNSGTLEPWNPGTLEPWNPGNTCCIATKEGRAPLWCVLTNQP
jgi:hypothetical protein